MCRSHVWYRVTYVCVALRWCGTIRMCTNKILNQIKRKQNFKSLAFGGRVRSERESLERNERGGGSVSAEG